jgi:hypothetical protein
MLAESVLIIGHFNDHQIVGIKKIDSMFKKYLGNRFTYKFHNPLIFQNEEFYGIYDKPLSD